MSFGCDCATIRRSEASGGAVSQPTAPIAAKARACEQISGHEILWVVRMSASITAVAVPPIDRSDQIAQI